MNAFFYIVLLGLSAQASQEKALYQQEVPKLFCPDIEKVDKNVKTCTDNRVYFQAAQECRKKFTELRKRVTSDAAKRLTTAGQEQKEFQGNQSANASESVDAQDYLISVGELALKELDEYFDFFEHPSDADTDEDILAEPCYMEPAEALNQLMDQLEDEVDQMKMAKAAGQLIQSNSNSNAIGLGADASLKSKAPINTKKGIGTALPKAHEPQKTKASDISGSEKLQEPSKP